ncbi:MAG: outer membrane beta-barrel protein [Pseudomonadota bacterium]
MSRFLVFWICCGCASAWGTDFTVLAGYQFNTDFEIASANELPSEPAFGTAEPGDDVQLDDGAAFAVALDFEFQGDPTKRIGLFVSYSQTEFEDNAGLTNRDLDITHVHFTAMSYYPQDALEPFVMAGVGAAFFSPKDSTLDDETKVSAQIGAGTNYRLSDSLLLRFDIRWLGTFFNSSGAAFCSGGCTIAVSSDTYSQVQANLGLMYRF